MPPKPTVKLDRCQVITGQRAGICPKAANTLILCDELYIWHHIKMYVFQSANIYNSLTSVWVHRCLATTGELPFYFVHLLPILTSYI